MAVNKLLLVALALFLALVLDEARACVCTAIYVPFCQRYDDADVVLQATVLSRSVTGLDATYTLGIITLFKGNDNTTYNDEINFNTPNSTYNCGVNLDIGEEYVLGLHASNGEGGYTVPFCHGLYELWSTTVEGELVGCGVDYCAGTCQEFEECKVYENNGKYYCSETCAYGACDEAETCSTQPSKWCSDTGFAGCPTKRTCS